MCHINLKVHVKFDNDTTSKSKSNRRVITSNWYGNWTKNDKFSYNKDIVII